MRFRFLPNIATADLAFEAFGHDYNELFENAGLALEDSMVKLDSIDSSESRAFNKEERSAENLLFSFLEELVYLKDAQLLVFNRIKCEVEQLSANSYQLSAKLSGERINAKKHKLGVDVKAVTKHLFEIKKLLDKTLRVQVILDV